MMEKTEEKIEHFPKSYFNGACWNCTLFKWKKVPRNFWEKYQRSADYESFRKRKYFETADGIVGPIDKETGKFHEQLEPIWGFCCERRKLVQVSSCCTEYVPREVVQPIIQILIIRDGSFGTSYFVAHVDAVQKTILDRWFQWRNLQAFLDPHEDYLFLQDWLRRARGFSLIEPWRDNGYAIYYHEIVQFHEDDCDYEVIEKCDQKLLLYDNCHLSPNEIKGVTGDGITLQALAWLEEFIVFHDSAEKVYEEL